MTPIMHLAEVLAHLVEREKIIDEVEKGAPQRALRQRRENLQALEGIEQALAVLEAEDLQGAAIQVLVAIGVIKMLTDDHEDRHLKDVLCRVEGLLQSAVAALGRAAEIDLARYRPPRYGVPEPRREEADGDDALTRDDPESDPSAGHEPSSAPA